MFPTFITSGRKRCSIYKSVVISTFFLVHITVMSAFAAIRPGTLQISGNILDPIDGASWSYKDITNNITYDLSGILYKPQGAGPFPAVIVNHGTGGSAQSYGKTIAKEMVQWGYVVIATNYTHQNKDLPCGSPGNCDDVSDWGDSRANVLRGMKAWEILNALGYVDTDNIMTFGFSRGAFVTTALAASYANKFRAATHCAGGIIPDSLSRKYPDIPTDSTALKIRCPYQMHHGTEDTKADTSMDHRLDSIFDISGIEHKLHIYQGYDHPEIAYDSTMFLRTKKFFNTARRSLPEKDQNTELDTF